MPAENEWTDKSKPLVNYALLNSANTPYPYLNQIVSIIGRVNINGVDPSGYKVTCDTSDHQSITLQMRTPLNEPLPNFVEFIVRVGRNVRELECLDYIPIKDDVTQNFDMDQFDKMIEVAHKFGTD